jgi:hypothetical protein
MFRAVLSIIEACYCVPLRVEKMTFLLMTFKNYSSNKHESLRGDKRLFIRHFVFLFRRATSERDETDMPWSERKVFWVFLLCFMSNQFTARCQIIFQSTAERFNAAYFFLQSSYQFLGDERVKNCCSMLRLIVLS